MNTTEWSIGTRPLGRECIHPSKAERHREPVLPLVVVASFSVPGGGDLAKYGASDGTHMYLRGRAGGSELERRL